MRIFRQFGGAALVAGAMAGCAAHVAPENPENAAGGEAYQAQYRAAALTTDEPGRARIDTLSAEMNASRCVAAGAPGAGVPPAALTEELLSRGDLLRVEIGDDEVFTGDYEISRDGSLKPPYLAAVPAQGLSAHEVEETLRARLVAEQFYPAPGPRVSVRVAEFAPAAVSVSGAVFEPGTVEIGRPGAETRDSVRQAARGASTEGRNLSAALRAAGGVRPDADLARIRLIRDGETHLIDASGAVDGGGFPDVMLIAGDRIEATSRNCFQEALMVPSSITPPGAKVFMSNLTKPADANALSAVGKDARELRYGTRFVQAVVGMNCVGGAKSTNADRSAVLFSRNPITGASVVIERSIEDLLRGAARDEFDPYILPGDALACYDSTATDLIEVARGIGAGAAISFLFSF